MNLYILEHKITYSLLIKTSLKLYAHCSGSLPGNLLTILPIISQNH